MKNEIFSASKLAELYKLLKLYCDSTECSDRPLVEHLLEEIHVRFNEAHKSTFSRISLDNPRGAGNYSYYFKDNRDEILKMRATGMTIRAISNATHNSVGYVHKIISSGGADSVSS